MRYAALFIVSAFLFFSAAAPVHAGCCLGENPESYLLGPEDCLNDTPPGQYVRHMDPNPETKQCEAAALSNTPINPEQLSDDTGTSSPLIFIPNIEIPGFFGGKIAVGSETIGQYIAAFYMFFVSVTAVLAVAMVIFAGFRWITAAGNQSHIEEAKDILNNALSGVVFVMLSYLLLNLINPTLTNLAGFQLSPIKPVLFSLEATFDSFKGAPPENAFIPAGEATIDLSKLYNIDTYDKLFAASAGRYAVNAALLKALMYVESGGNPRAKSPVGACGLMQVMPQNVGQTDCDGLVPPAGTNPGDKAYDDAVAKNIDKGAELFRRFFYNTCPSSAPSGGVTVTCDAQKSGCKEQEPYYAVAAYNGGFAANCSSRSCPGQTFWECPENWKKKVDGSTGFLETSRYVPNVIAVYNHILSKGWVPQ